MKTLCDALIPQGYSATCLTSASDALALLREQPFDLLLRQYEHAGDGWRCFLPCCARNRFRPGWHCDHRTGRGG